MHGRVSNVGNVVSLLGAFVATAMVIGLLAAGLLIPAVGATGTAANSGVEAFDNLPSEFTSTPLSQQSRILDAEGNVIATPQDENRIIVDLKDIAPIMQKAQIAIEDSRFYEHGGVDPRGISRALVSNLQGNDTQGASTLTQQYVKLTLQENALRNNDEEAAKAAVEVSPARKLRELKYAVTLEKEMTKDQILRGYLNLAYYGDLAYGVEAAAQHYFSVSGQEAQHRPGRAAGRARAEPEQDRPHAQPGEGPGPPRRRPRPDAHAGDHHRQGPTGLEGGPGQEDAQGQAAAEQLRRLEAAVLLQLRPRLPQDTMPALGKSVPERLKNITQGGLTIQTTLEPGTQKMADAQELTKRVPHRQQGRHRRRGLDRRARHRQGPGDGAEHHLHHGQGQRDQGADPGQLERRPQVRRQNGFQFGSTAKMYAIVTALQRGTPVNGTVAAKYATAKQAAVYTPAGAGQVRRPEGAGPSATTSPTAASRSPSSGPRRSRSTPRSRRSSSSSAPRTCRRP